MFVSDTVYYKCEDNGTWYFHKPFNKPWVNYTTCVNTDDLSVSFFSYIICSFSAIINLGGYYLLPN